MKKRAMIKFVVAILAVAPMVALSEGAASSLKSSNGEEAKAHRRKPSALKKEFMGWAAKQDWFALSAKAEFGDMNRGKMLENGRTFGYSTEFVDSKGRKHVLGIGLAKEPEQEEKRVEKKKMAAMCAKKNLAMHGMPVSTDASGKQTRSFTGAVSGSATVLSKTILRPGTEEKWILCVVRKESTGHAQKKKEK